MLYTDHKGIPEKHDAGGELGITVGLPGCAKHETVRSNGAINW